MRSYEYKRNAFDFSLIGSDDVVRAFNNLVQYVYQVDVDADKKPDPKEMLLRWGAFLLEIRRNVGDSETQLTEADMLKGHIKGIDAVLMS